MVKEFEPYHKEKDTGEFTSWEFRKDEQEPEPTISKEEELLAECEHLRQEAVQKGYEEGMRNAKAEIDNEKKELIEWLTLLKNPVQLLDEKLTQELIHSLVWLSEYCIGVELSVYPEKLRQLFDRIKEELPSLQGNILFAMHPTDIEWIKQEIGVSEVPGLHDVLVADPLLSRGDFYLKSEHSELDGRLHTRLITLFAKYIDKDILITPIKSQE